MKSLISNKTGLSVFSVSMDPNLPWETIVSESYIMSVCFNFNIDFSIDA